MGNDVQGKDKRESRLGVKTKPPSTARIAEGVAPLQPSSGNEGVLAAISNQIDDNLGYFRAGMAIMMVGSAVTISFLAYRRGLHGFSSAGQVPASYFERRKRLRVRIAKITTASAAPPTSSGQPEGRGRCFGVNGRDMPKAGLEGSDVLLHAEHITLPRRLLRLPPRSLLPSAGGGDAASFTLRLCGVSAEMEGILFARDELVKPLVGSYCDAELLFREQRSRESRSANPGVGPVAVCHIHRRRDVLWRDMLQYRLDPRAGFGEYLISEGLARCREELWWATYYNNFEPAAAVIKSPSLSAARTNRRSIGDQSPVGGGEDFEQSLPALKRLLEDRDGFVAAEEGAKRARRGLWGLPPHGDEVAGRAVATARSDGGAAKGLRTRAASVLRTMMGLFGRRW